MEIFFNDRQDAGIQLAEKLKLEFSHRSDLILLALPRGGVPIAAEISRKLKIPFDVLVVRKIGHPRNEEFGIGALMEDGSYWINPIYLNVSTSIDNMIENIISKERDELKRRIELYRQNRSLPNMNNKTVVLIDDGLATGVTAGLAANFVKKMGASEVILAIPVCAAESASKLRKKGIIVKTLQEPSSFSSVAEHYFNFTQVSDRDVLQNLRFNPSS